MPYADIEERRECQRESKRRWREANPNKVSERVQKWRKANPDKVRRISRRNDLKKKFGITIEQFDNMLVAQGGCCALCGTLEPGGNKSFRVDHDHDTGIIRGLLCHHCNVGLGHFKDNPSLLQQAINYLGRAQ